MRIEIWSDIVCPWCYIGKRRLETALAGFEHRDEVEVVWRSFQLDPGSPPQPDTSVSMAEHLGRKYGGGPDAGQQMIDRMEAVAAEEGLIYRLGQAQRVSTLDAHRLLHAAGERQDALKEALLHAYMMEGENIADHDDADPGGRRGRARRRRGRADPGLRRAQGRGVRRPRPGRRLWHQRRAVLRARPKLAISGAQPAEVFTQALHQAWDAAHPVLQMAGDGTGDGEACGPEGCAV